jgi:hypothetical protein
VSGRDLRPDSRATLRHNREKKSDHIKSDPPLFGKGGRLQS